MTLYGIKKDNDGDGHLVEITGDGSGGGVYIVDITGRESLDWQEVKEICEIGANTPIKIKVGQESGAQWFDVVNVLTPNESMDIYGIFATSFQVVVGNNRAEMYRLYITGNGDINIDVVTFGEVAEV